MATVVLAALPQTAAAESENCATLEARGEGVNLVAPDRLVFDREGSVKIFGDSQARLLFGHLSFTSGADVGPLTLELTPAEVASVNDLGEYARFPIRVGDGDGPVAVRLSYSWRDRGTGDVCDSLEEATVRPFQGAAPRPRLYWSDETRLTLRVPCERLAPGRLRVVFSHRGRTRRMVLRTDPCGPGSPYSSGGSYPGWTQRGAPMPGLRFLRDDPLVAYQVGGYDWKRIYRVEVFWGAERVLRRWLWVSNQHDPARRIYEDEADHFYTYCAAYWTEGDLPVRRDARRRKYCLLPPADYERGHVFETPPPWH